MKPFKHKDAKTINEAVKLQRKGKTKLIAGGTDLLGILKDKIPPEYPETVINIKTIPNLDYIRADCQRAQSRCPDKARGYRRLPRHQRKI